MVVRASSVYRRNLPSANPEDSCRLVLLRITAPWGRAFDEEHRGRMTRGSWPSGDVGVLVKNWFM
jgi:hypothetical protein